MRGSPCQVRRLLNPLDDWHRPTFKTRFLCSMMAAAAATVISWAAENLA